MKDNWWTKKAEEMKGRTDRNDTLGLFFAIRAICEPRTNAVTPVKSADGSKLFTDKSEITERWREHFCTLPSQ